MRMSVVALNIKLVPLRLRPDLCEFFAGKFEAEWPGWYGPGKADALADLRNFANERGDLPDGVIALDESGSQALRIFEHAAARGKVTDAA